MKWEYLTLDQLGSVSRGRSKHRPRNDESLFGGDYPFIQTGDIKKAGLHITDFVETYNEKGLAQSKLWDPGTLCITIAANIADTSILGIKACFPDSIIGFIANPNKCDVRFVKYSFDILQKKCQAMALGATQDNLSWEKMSKIKFLIPPLPTQQKIASILSTYDILIENNTKRIRLLEQMAENLYKEWFVRFRFPGHENVEMENGLPKGWKISRLADFGRIETGKTPSMEHIEYYGGDYLFIKTPDMHGSMFVYSTEDTLSEEGNKCQKKKLLPPDSIMVSCIGSGGVVAINAKPGHTNQQINSIILSNKEQLEWLYFTCVALKPTIELFGATGATMTNLSKGKFEKLKVIEPQAKLISNFHKMVAPIFKQIKLVLRQNEYLTRQRDLLLPRLMSGKLEVTV